MYDTYHSLCSEGARVQGVVGDGCESRGEHVDALREVHEGRGGVCHMGQSEHRVHQQFVDCADIGQHSREGPDVLFCLVVPVCRVGVPEGVVDERAALVSASKDVPHQPSEAIPFSNRKILWDTP